MSRTAPARPRGARSGDASASPPESQAPLAVFDPSATDPSAVGPSVLSSAEADDLDEVLSQEQSRFNDPMRMDLPDPRQIGGSGITNDGFFGSPGVERGIAVMPPIYASASRFPTAVQLRVWLMEQGRPALAGTCSIEATMEDFIRIFYRMMPLPGQGSAQFLLRPLTMNGQELNDQQTVLVHEHNVELERIRESKRQAAEEERGAVSTNNIPPMFYPPYPPQDNASALDELGRMTEQVLAANQEQARIAQERLDEERQRMLEDERARAEQRLRESENSARTVQTLMERMLQSDRDRAKEQMTSQGAQSNLLLTTLTTVFSQQQAMAAEQREAERSRSEQARKEAAEQFQRALQEARESRKAEEDATIRRLQDEERRREAVFKEERELADRRLLQIRAELDEESKRRAAVLERERQETAERLAAEQRRHEQRLEAERNEFTLRLEQAKLELAQERIRIEAAQAAARAEIEAKDRARREEAERHDKERREEAERRERAERDERERRAQADREDRERRERREAEERRERIEREERAEKRHKEEQEMIRLRIEKQAEHDRAYQEHLQALARQEREAQREAAERAERAAAAQREVEREAARMLHEQTMKAQEAEREQAREHAIRMAEIERSKNSGGFDKIGEMLGMSAPEVMERIFAPPAAPESNGWQKAIGPVAGAMTEMFKSVMNRGGGAETPRRNAKPTSINAALNQHPQSVPTAPTEEMVQIMGPNGPQIVSIAQARALGFISQEEAMAQQAQQNQGVPQRVLPAPTNLPHPLTGVNNGRTPFGAMLQTARQGTAPLALPPMQGPRVQNPEEITPVPQPEGSSAEATPDVITEVTPEQLMARAVKVNTRRLAADAGIVTLDQNKFKRFLKTLAEELRTKPDEEWSDTITERFTSNMAVIDYIQAVSLFVAMAEAGCDYAMIEKIETGLKEIPFVPEDFNYRGGVQ